MSQNVGVFVDVSNLFYSAKSAGVEVNYKMYDGVTHEFFGMATVVPDAKDAQAFAAGNLKTAFR